MNEILHSMKFKVVSHTSLEPKDINKVFMRNPPGPHVVIGAHVYNTGRNSNVLTNEIEMNMVHRMAHEIRLNDEIPVHEFDEITVPLIKSIQVLINGRDAKSRNLPFDRDIMKEYIYTYLGNTVFTHDCSHILIMGDAKYVAKFVFDDYSIMAGRIDKTTTIEFDSKDVVISTNELFKPNINIQDLGVGGLGMEFMTIFRRAFASRMLPMEMQKSMGINHVRGILMYGPPGCGKTALARQIGKMLNCKGPKIVAGPALLDKWVGSSEKNVRDLFADAFADKSGKNLYLVICDEFDSICQQRNSRSDSSGVSDRIVNQLLAMIDGPESLNNVLLICMTNRKDIIDSAMLRPGRLEVQIEIPLPDSKGRQEILMIHTNTLIKSGHLDSNINLDNIAHRATNFTGAEIEGLVKAASSYAVQRSVKFEGTPSIDTKTKPIVTMEDFELAFSDIAPMFGHSDNMHIYTKQKLTSPSLITLYDEFMTISYTGMMSYLITGPPRTGKTVLASHVAQNIGASFTRMITMENGSESIDRAFDDAMKVNSSVIILDNFERLIGWCEIGYKYDNTILQKILFRLRQPMRPNQSMLVIVTAYDELLCDKIGLGHIIDEKRNSL